jgi:hypothetical protein
MYVAQKSSDEGQRQPVVGPLDAEELYRRYLRIRAEREISRNGTNHTVTEFKKANSGDILS